MHGTGFHSPTQLNLYDNLINAVLVSTASVGTSDRALMTALEMLQFLEEMLLSNRSCTRSSTAQTVLKVVRSHQATVEVRASTSLPWLLLTVRKSVSPSGTSLEDDLAKEVTYPRSHPIISFPWSTSLSCLTILQISVMNSL